MGLKAIALTDAGKKVTAGYVSPTRGTTVRVNNIILRGWKLSKASVGEGIEPAMIGEFPDRETLPEAIAIVNTTGPLGVPKKPCEYGAGFLVKSNGRTQVEYVVGIGPKETVKVDGKDLEVTIIINVE